MQETLEALQKGIISEQELNQAYQDRVSILNPKLNAYLTICEGHSGIPAGIKDIILTKGIKTTAASKILDDFIPPYSATVIEKLLKQNIRVIGKTNCDEFALGSSGENSAFGPTRNPWDVTKVPGGSSSGSAAAVSADMCVFALGTDTGGSIRQPAALSGIVGFKPSYGRVSRYGAISVASSLDQIGPMTKSVADARLVLDWISGGDNYDSNVWVKSPAKTLATIKGLKIGIAGEYFSQGLDAGVEKVVKQAIKKLEEMGAEIVDISLPHTECAVETYYIIMSSELSSNLARFDGIRFGKARELFGPEVKRRIMLGTFALSSGFYEDYFIKAAKVRSLIKKDFEKAFEKCDVIAGPVSPTVGWNLGEKTNNPLQMYLSDIYTIPANLAGIPGLSVPCGFSQDLPVGLQILGKYLDDETVLRVGEIYQEATVWRKEKPKI